MFLVVATQTERRTETRARLLEAGITHTSDTDPDGSGPGSIACTDPDGYAVLIDQHVPRG